jgi:uncharacterized protein (TIGR02391 family)
LVEERDYMPRELELPELPILSRSDIERGIVELEKRIQELKALPPSSVRSTESARWGLEQRIMNSLAGLYGPRAPLQSRYHGLDLSQGSEHVIAILKRTLSALQTALIDAPDERVRRTRPQHEVHLRLHPRIESAALGLLRGGHYRSAILDACLALRDYARETSGRPDLDGADLMRTVFSKNRPLVTFNALADQSDVDEQEGLMHLFEGAWLAFRNPRAHDLEQDSEQYALECLAFLSMLANRLDRAKGPNA